jgi:hypothetical protein
MSRNTTATLIAFGMTAAGALHAAPAGAADHMNLDGGLPITIEDAFPIPYRQSEAQALGQYDNVRDDPRGHNLVTLGPRLEAGLFRNFQAEVGVPYSLGNTSDRNSGAVNMDGLYNFNAETLSIPAFALKAGVGVPFGRDSQGAETVLKGIATKTIGETWNNRRVHLNAAWVHKYDRRKEDERSNGYLIAAGYSQPVASDTVVVADLVRESFIEDDRESNVVEAGVRWQLTPLTVVSAGAGAGFLDESPKFRFLVGIQHTLTLFPLY